MGNGSATAEKDLWALWPDGVMCPAEEIEEHLTCGKSDDYALVEVLSYDETGHPKEWAAHERGKKETGGASTETSP